MSFLIFIFGLLLGSFLNCLVYRLNEAKNWSQFFFGRSYCPKCKKKLAWFDNIPLLSFLFLKGKCRWCHSPISWRYPLVELATGILSVMVYYFSANSVANLIFNLIMIYALIGIFLSDLLYRTIPDQIVYPAIVIALLWLIVNNQWQSVLSGLGAALFFLLLVLLTRWQGMGLGDVKLAGLMGLILGFPKIIVALYLAFLTGALVGVILVLTKRKRLKSEISFGPFLAISTFMALFWGEKIWHFFL
ncbi:prepilin peptidase [Patescibacteria group bacterium]|nr:prepilin peptidase [Patescibacteria group bacterium]